MCGDMGVPPLTSCMRTSSSLFPPVAGDIVHCGHDVSSAKQTHSMRPPSEPSRHFPSMKMPVGISTAPEKTGVSNLWVYTAGMVEEMRGRRRGGGGVRKRRQGRFRRQLIYEPMTKTASPPPFVSGDREG